MLQRLKIEILNKEIDACLPSNLDDEWLEALASSSDSLLENEADGPVVSASLCVAVMMRLLAAKGISTPIEDARAYFVMYRLELTLEEIARKTNIKYNAATLDTILTERKIETWKEG